jgi:hypothetical protein
VVEVAELGQLYSADGELEAPCRERRICSTSGMASTPSSFMHFRQYGRGRENAKFRSFFKDRSTSSRLNWTFLWNTGHPQFEQMRGHSSGQRGHNGTRPKRRMVLVTAGRNFMGITESSLGHSKGPPCLSKPLFNCTSQSHRC